MKLNEKSMENLKRALREDIEKQLINIPDGQRIHLDKALLEVLLFDKIQVPILGHQSIKCPIWSGPFLRKIDLSEVSFDNVAWSLSGDVDTDRDFIEKYRYITGDVFGIDNESYKECIKIDYSYTNANIDFSKADKIGSYDDCGRKPMLSIRNCNLAGVDLSNNNCDGYVLDFVNCDISNTGLKVGEIICIDRCNFENLDLSEICFDFEEIFDKRKYISISFSNFSNTGLKFNGDIEKLNDEQKNVLYTAIKEGRLNGCYLNGKLITGVEHLQGLNADKKSEYEKMKEELIASITQSIEEQKKSFKK